MTSAEASVPLEGRVLAIAGAGGALGPTVVRRLAPTGARLALAGREAGPLEALASEVGVDADVTSVDLLDAAATRGWAEGIAERMGRVDGLLHLVGGWRGGTPIEESPREDWDFLAGLLIDTLQNVTQAFTPHLLASGRGRFAIVSAAQAQAPTHTNAAYAAAKAAAEAWTLALAHRFVGTGATANIVVVGSIVSPEMRAEDPDKDFSTFTPAESIADALAFLCSDAAASMNGQRLTLRGAV
jgi:NAD(P)-dependent dehydrogenase (short-subunit alcohol dehydrogenase family)